MADIAKLDYLFNKIKEPIVCVKCSHEFLSGQTDSKSLQEYSKIDVGFTERGLQIWCQRHQLNICHINFDGKKLETDFRCCLLYTSPSPRDVEESRMPSSA